MTDSHQMQPPLPHGQEDESSRLEERTRLIGRKDLETAIFLALLALSLCSGYMVYRWIFPTPRTTITRPEELKYEYKVNINTDSMIELMLIPQVGKKTALKILEYRSTHGNFTAIDQLLKIKGIGQKTLDKMRPHLEINPNETHLAP